MTNNTAQGVSWYRVDISSNGIKSAEKVDSAGTGDSRVYYLRANSKEEACREAKEIYRRIGNERGRAARERARSRGVCPKCYARELPTGQKSCNKCKAVEKEKSQMKRDRDSSGKPYTKQEAQEKKSTTRSTRHMTLLEVQDEFKKPGFASWLRREIATCERIQELKVSSANYRKELEKV